jgi:hypothetical protein
MDAEARIDTTRFERFDFTGCFYHASDDKDKEICNVTVACAIMLVWLGSFQDESINRQGLMNTITTIARDGNRTAKERTDTVRVVLGNKIKFKLKTNETKLVAGGNSIYDTPVDQVDRLHNYKKDGVFDRCDLVSFLLAHFNLPNTVAPMQRSIVDAYSTDNNLLYSLLDAMLRLFETNDFQTLHRNGDYFKLPFPGTDIGLVTDQPSSMRNLSIALPADLKVEEKKAITSCLSDIQTAVEQVNTSTIQTDARPQNIGKSIDNADLNYCEDFNDHNDHCDKCDDFCDNVKENFIEHPHIVLFIIAAAALLAGTAVALTTYFHVGTTLMLAAGFIPFLNFVGGFQISLLLGVVSFATVCAGVCVVVKKRVKCYNTKQYSVVSSSSSTYKSSDNSDDSEPAETDDKAVAVNE